MEEDALDKHVVRKLEEKTRGPFPLLFISFHTPARSTANIFRFRLPWYLDGRHVAAKSFWNEPEGENEPASEHDDERAQGGAAVSSVERKQAPLPEWPHYGGVHEFGAWWGISP